MNAPTKPQRSPKIGTAEEQRFLRRVDWNLFRQFFEIAQSGSVSAAARRLNLRQPSLSAALKRLEDHLGLALCRRTVSGIELTAAGKALLSLTSEMMESARRAPHLTSQAAEQVQGSLSIRMISNVICREFDDALGSFHQRNPAVEISVAVAPWRDVLDAVSRGECDLGVSHDNALRPHLQYEALFRETQQVYCGRHHPLYGQRLRDPNTLVSEYFIVTHGDEPEDLTTFRQRFGLGRNASGHTEDLHEAARLIEIGVGIGFLPTIVARARSRENLWPILDLTALPSYPIYLVAQPPARVSTPSQIFLDEVRRRLAAAASR